MGALDTDTASTCIVTVFNNSKVNPVASILFTALQMPYQPQLGIIKLCNHAFVNHLGQLVSTAESDNCPNILDPIVLFVRNYFT